MHELNSVLVHISNIFGLNFSCAQVRVLLFSCKRCCAVTVLKSNDHTIWSIIFDFVSLFVKGGLHFPPTPAPDVAFVTFSRLFMNFVRDNRETNFLLSCRATFAKKLSVTSNSTYLP